MEIKAAIIRIFRVKSSQASMKSFKADFSIFFAFLLLPKAIILPLMSSLFIPVLGSTYKRFKIWLWPDSEIKNLPFSQPDQFPLQKSLIESN
jgi:hypothetical protein